MDTTDRDIVFDEAGVCNHCRQYEAQSRQRLMVGVERERRLEATIAMIREAGKGRDYDCILGVSGGVDSTYAALLLKRFGLRPLAVHMDNGWNSELAVFNIERVLQRLGIDLNTDVLDWHEFKDLQRSFLKASVPDGEIPTDHAIEAVLQRAAVRHGCKFVINGHNAVSEGLLPVTWTYGVSDWRYIKGIHRRFGTVPLRTFPHYTLRSQYVNASVRGIKTVWILDLVDYVKDDAKRIVESELGWRDYGGKHHESIYTRFFQGYILPRKFNIDKRRSHLSTLIGSGQVTRDAALAELEKPPYSEALQEDDREYVLKKLEMTDAEFAEIMALPPKTFESYPNIRRFFPLLRFAARTARALRILPKRR